MIRNDSKIAYILAHIKKLPYFRLEDLRGLSADKIYLKILFSRYAEKGVLVRLKRGLYTTQYFLDESQKQHTFSAYTECVANILYPPSYLSLDYILYRHQILTEIPQNFTAMTPRKTYRLRNPLGTFFYHTIRPDLFKGFTIESRHPFQIAAATPAKALFDFLYLRKNLLNSPQAIEELRLNLKSFIKKEQTELKSYIEAEGSGKMKLIFKILFGRTAWK